MDGERRGAIVLGTVLVVVGVAALVLRSLGIDLALGWPLLVIVPGIALFVGAFAVGGEPGGGLAVAGATVTMVGLILAVQDATGLWATWAYAWALVAPTGVGIGLVLYGLGTGQRGLVAAGLAPLGVGLALFSGFALFFEGVIGLSGDRVPALQAVLPVALVVLGALVVLAGLRGRRD